MKEKCCLLLLVIIVFGSLVVFQEPLELEGVEEEVNNMTIYNYIKEVDTVDDIYPINSHLCIEYFDDPDYFIYLVPFQNTLTIVKLDTSDGSYSTITTETDYITKFYYDRANDKIYYYHGITVGYVDLTDDSTTDLNGTINNVKDIFVYDSSVFAVDTAEDDLTYYKYSAGAWGAVGTISMGSTNYFEVGTLGGNDLLQGLCFDGTYFYVTDQDGSVYKYNSDFSSLEASYDIGALGGNDAPFSICWDGTFFYVTDKVDDLVYKYPSDFSVLTASYDIGALGGNDNPKGIEWDGNYFYVTDNADGYVYKYPSDFSVITATLDLTSFGIAAPIGITFDDIYFYVLDSVNPETVYKFNSTFTILLGTYNVQRLGTNTQARNMCWSGTYFYITEDPDVTDNRIYKYSYDFTETGELSFIVLDGANVYVCYKYSGDSTGDLYIKDLSDSSNPSSVESLGANMIIPNNENQKGIAFDNSDVLFFILLDTSDSKHYLYSYKIATDVLTKGSEYQISIMLDRNSNSSNPIPRNLEKAFHLTNRYIFQIALNSGQLYKIADLTTLVADGTIISITDTFVFIKRTDNTIEVWKFQDMSNHIISSEIKHCERDYPTCEIIYDIRGIKLTSDMFIQIIGTLESVADQVIFEGYVEKPELLDERGKYVYIATLRSPAYRDLDFSFPNGSYTGRSDEHIEDDITENDGYITKGTFSNGQALATIAYAGDKVRRVIYNELGAGDQFTWALTPTGGMLYNNGAVDSGVNYSEATPIYDVHESNREVRVNWVKVKGALVDGVQVGSTVREDKELQQQYGGKIKFEITIGFIDTVALANAWGDALLALLKAQMHEVIFKCRDTTNGFIQPSKEITLAYSKIPTITSAQYKINQIIYNDRTKKTEYIVSSILRYEFADFRGKLAQDNQELLIQINAHLVSNIADLATHEALDTHQKYVPRTGAHAWDYNNTLTQDAAYHTLDLSAILPAGCVAVSLWLIFEDNAINKLFRIRKDSTDTRYIELRNSVANVYIGLQCTIGVTASRTIEYYLSSGIDNHRFMVLGWFV